MVDQTGQDKYSGSNNSIRNLKINFALPNNVIHAGDTSTISLPDSFTFSSATRFNVYASDNTTLVARAVIDPVSRTLVLTYTDYPETHSNVTGSLQAAIKINTQKITHEQTIPLSIHVGQNVVRVGDYHYTGFIGDSPTERFAKWGWRASDETNNKILHYNLRVNATGAVLKNVHVTDQLQSAGMSYVKTSFHIFHGHWTYNPATSYWEMNDRREVTDKTVSYTNNDQGFDIDLGSLNTDGYLIRYDVDLNHVPVNNELFKNYAATWHNDHQLYQDGQNGYIWQSASGQANGYNYTLVVKKTDETSTPLKGASFQITRDRSGQIIDTVTTNDQGEATVTGLLMDDYTISETKAPAGYDFIDPVHVHADQFDNTAKTAVLTVQDKTLTTQLDVDKTWDDHDNQDGIRPDHVSVQLYANDQPSGSPVTLNAANNWHHAFVNLPVMKNGKRITYTVKEVNVPEGYTPSMSMSQARCDCGYTITNTHTPEVTRIQGVKT
ncbi:Cna B-type domain-containing protein, partial [Alloscardovia theropitheci]